jgi:phosphate transport system substrate-binding protein
MGRRGERERGRGGDGRVAHRFSGGGREFSPRLPRTIQSLPPLTRWGTRMNAGARKIVLPLIGLLALNLCTGCAAARVAPAIKIRMTGAQIATELVESWLNDAKSPRFDVEKPVFPTWSQVGFEHLARGECDLACTDRPITARELPAFKDRQIQGYRVAFYGYALYVHPDNPLDSIFSGHISLLFQKKLVDWKELGGAQLPDLAGPIQLYGPRKATRGGMFLMQRAKIWFANPTWEVLDSDEAVIAKVAADPAALGLASVGYDGQGVRSLGIRMERTSRPAQPSLEEIESERYGLAKVIYVYYVAPPTAEPGNSSPGSDPGMNAGAPTGRPSGTGPAVIDYLFSDAGRRAIESTDVWPIDRARAPVTTIP